MHSPVRGVHVMPQAAEGYPGPGYIAQLVDRRDHHCEPLGHPSGTGLSEQLALQDLSRKANIEGLPVWSMAPEPGLTIGRVVV